MPALAHFGIGLATKRFIPQLPLWVLLLSTMLIDVLSIVFIFAPIWSSHGFFMAVIWSVIAMIVTVLTAKYFKSKKEVNNIKNSTIHIFYTSMIIGLLVFSHWVLDFIGWPMSVIDPDATGVPFLFDDSQTLGLGVYSTWFGAIIMDIGMFIMGLAIYILTLKKLKTEKKMLNESKSSSNNQKL